MSIELDCNKNPNLQDINEEDPSEKNFEILLVTINKQIDFLKNKFNFFDFQEKSIQNTQNSYYRDIEKIENNKELFSLKIDEM